MSKIMIREMNQKLLEILFRDHLAKDEKGNRPASQASQLLQSGWDGIGYLMLSPKLGEGTHGGLDRSDRLTGRKRAAFDAASAQELEAWFQERLAEGLLPGWRYYLKQGKRSVPASDFKSTVVHQGQHGLYHVTVEFIWKMQGKRGDREATEVVAATATENISAIAVADEFATVGMIASAGGKVVYDVLS